MLFDDRAFFGGAHLDETLRDLVGEPVHEDLEGCVVVVHGVVRRRIEEVHMVIVLVAETDRAPRDDRAERPSIIVERGVLTVGEVLVLSLVGQERDILGADARDDAFDGANETCSSAGDHRQRPIVNEERRLAQQVGVAGFAAERGEHLGVGGLDDFVPEGVAKGAQGSAGVAEGKFDLFLRSFEESRLGHMAAKMAQQSRRRQCTSYLGLSAFC